MTLKSSIFQYSIKKNLPVDFTYKIDFIWVVREPF